MNTSFILFFLFVFLTPVFVPLEAMTDWMATVASYDPVTSLLGALRSILTVGWDLDALAKGLLSIAGVGVVSFTLALLALRGRVARR